jgi:hypothetical protein
MAQYDQARQQKALILKTQKNGGGYPSRKEISFFFKVFPLFDQRYIVEKLRKDRSKNPVAISHARSSTYNHN